MNNEMIEKLKQIQAENENLKKALQALYNEQNGAPLLRDKKDWEKAMNMAEKALQNTRKGELR